MTAAGPDVDVFLDRLRGIAAEWEHAHEELGRMRVTATSDDGLATAAADAQGTVVDLSLGAEPRRLGPATTAAAILQACSRAVVEANARRSALVSHSVSLAVGARGDVPERPAAH